MSKRDLSFFVKLLLLLALSFNVAHAVFIASHDSHNQAFVDKAPQAKVHQAQSSSNNDLCELHHLFHIPAIIDVAPYAYVFDVADPKPVSIRSLYRMFYFERKTKPPIA